MCVCLNSSHYYPNFLRSKLDWQENKKLNSNIAAIDTFENYISFNWLNIKVSLVIQLVVSRRPSRHSRSTNLVCSNYRTNSLLRKICEGHGYTNAKNMIINVIFNSTLFGYLDEILIKSLIIYKHKWFWCLATLLD